MTWENYYWSYGVHEHLGETLHFYFLRLRPFDAGAIRAGMLKLIQKEHLGSIKCYPVYGRFDLVVEAWLHPIVAEEFPKQLDEVLEDIRDLYSFSAKLVHSWNKGGRQESSDSLAGLNEKRIRLLQEGKEEALLHRHIDAGVVGEDSGNCEGIRFFLSIKLAEHMNIKKNEEADKLASLFSRHSDIFNVEAYAGIGDFCTLLIKAEAADFYSIADLPLEVSNAQHNFDNTETFLCATRDYLVADFRIAPATFDVLRGVNLTARNLVPEIYSRSKHLPGKAGKIQKIVDLVIERFDNAEIRKNQRMVIRNYLLAYLMEDETKMTSEIFQVLISFEKYLRENLRPFIGKACGAESFDTIFSAAGFEKKEARKHLALGSLIRVYQAAAQVSEKTLDPEIFSSFNDLTQIRNETAHGELDVSGDNWSRPIRVLWDSLEPAQRFLAGISGVTGSRYSSLFY